jgi:hypothetical protein
MNRATMNNGIMTNGNVTSNDGLRFQIGTMNDGPILHIHFIADADAVHVTPDYRIEPNTAIVADDHIAHDGAIGSKKAIVTDFGRYTFHGKDNGHI